MREEDRLSIEKALLLWRWDPSLSSSVQEPSAELAQALLAGDLKKVLTSPPARDLFLVRVPRGSTAIQHYLLSAFFPTFSTQTQDPESELTHLIIGITCLQAFIQANWTGPNLDFTPSDILVFPTSTPDDHPLTDAFLNSKSTSELSYNGEPAYHLSTHPFLLRLAQLILTSQSFTHLASTPWWHLRLLLTHQNILDEPVSPPEPELTALESKLASLLTSALCTTTTTTTTITSNPELSARLLLEHGILKHVLGQDKSAAELFVQAARSTGLQYELTGALGKRTKFQQTDLSQLVLLAQSNLQIDDVEKKDDVATTTTTTTTTTERVVVPQSLALNDDTLLEQTQFTSSSSTTSTSSSPLHHLDPGSQPSLHPLDQSILLSLCLNIKNTSPTHGLTTEQISPYISRVLTHPLNWSIHTTALLLRSRLEANRTRTVERATLQLQALIDQMPTSDSTVRERLEYFYALHLPSRWVLERELAERFASLGVFKSALEVYERLEMWEDVVKCYSSLERPEKGIAIVRDLLEGRKREVDAVLKEGKNQSVSAEKRAILDRTREAKLWCLLGDLEPHQAKDHYTKAWSVSRATSGRAMRSLGGWHFSRGEYAEAVVCLRCAVAMNPLMARSWFVLGCACMRVEDWAGATEAFGRCVRIDEEDAESWSNLAGCWLRMGKIVSGSGGGADAKDEGEGEESEAKGDETSQHQVPFENKILAWRALKQGLKYSYDNWKMWYNYMVVSVDVGELFEAARALGRVVEETSGSGSGSGRSGGVVLDADVLERLVDAVTKDAVGTAEAVQQGEQQQQQQQSSGGLSRTVTQLFEQTILPRVSSDSRVFHAYGRLMTHQGRWGDAVKAYMDAYRNRSGGAGTWGVVVASPVKVVSGDQESSSGAGGEEVGGEVQRWREAVREVEGVVDMLRNFGPRAQEEQEGEGTAGGKWRMQARSVVRTFMGRSKEYEDEPEWERLVELLEELKN
ncbi:hypothetical protein AMATHDRAFT_47904 [Amanita thiersii Skay4041]|uniref:Uncharacterized protein n=1 Tax=Amanita thiersii Skay4041 TaxID=703135 RepID=A0A2A9NHE3_9AGAR|nr:hypothetical protein AMATHDRAFT_47904 [Amanita thiersii Skay4041]